MIKIFNTLFVTMFGLGKIPKIPGTFGSLATIIILYIFFHIINLSSIIILIILTIILILSFLTVSIHIKNKENKDPKEVIIDEFIGQSIPIYLYEISHGTEKSNNEAIIFYGICFILFRFFDIAKIFPANIIDKRMNNSLGVLLDDLVASIYTVIVLYSINVFI